MLATIALLQMAGQLQLIDASLRGEKCGRVSHVPQRSAPSAA